MSAPLLRPQIFDRLSVATVLLAALMSAWRDAAVKPAPFALPSPAALQGQAGAVANTDSAAVVNANVFSASRHVPRVHYVSPDALGNAPALPSPMRPMSADSTGHDSASVATDAAPHLYGIISQGSVRRALLRLSDRDHDPQLFSEGDIHDGWQVMRVDTDRVTLRPTRRGATALRTLRLVPRSPSDTSGTTP